MVDSFGTHTIPIKIITDCIMIMDMMIHIMQITTIRAVAATRLHTLGAVTQGTRTAHHTIITITMDQTITPMQAPRPTVTQPWQLTIQLTF